MTAHALPLDIPITHTEIDKAYLSVNVVPTEGARREYITVFVHAGGEVVAIQIRPEDQVDRLFGRLQKMARLVRAEMQDDGDDCVECGWITDELLEQHNRGVCASRTPRVVDEADPNLLPDDSDEDDSAEWQDVLRERSAKEEALDDLTAELDREYRAERDRHWED